MWGWAINNTQLCMHKHVHQGYSVLIHGHMGGRSSTDRCQQFGAEKKVVIYHHAAAMAMHQACIPQTINQWLNMVNWQWWLVDQAVLAIVKPDWPTIIIDSTHHEYHWLTGILTIVKHDWPWLIMITIDYPIRHDWPWLSFIHDHQSVLIPFPAVETWICPINLNDLDQG